MNFKINENNFKHKYNILKNIHININYILNFCMYVYVYFYKKL